MSRRIVFGAAHALGGHLGWLAVSGRFASEKEGGVSLPSPPAGRPAFRSLAIFSKASVTLASFTARLPGGLDAEPSLGNTAFTEPPWCPASCGAKLSLPEAHRSARLNPA